MRVQIACKGNHIFLNKWTPPNYWNNKNLCDITRNKTTG